MNQLLFREKLTPPFWAWLFLIGIALMFSVSLSAVFGNLVASVCFFILISVFLVSTLKFSPQIKVDEEYFYAGKAKLPLNIITKIQTLNAIETTELRGIKADLKSFHAVSPLISSSVKIEFNDIADPHTYWLVSTRKGPLLEQLLNKKLDLE